MEIKKFLTRNWYLSAGITGVASGVAVAAVDPIHLHLFSFSFYTYPGGIFGIMSACYFYVFLRPRPTITRSVIWIFASIASYALAVEWMVYMQYSRLFGDYYLFGFRIWASIVFGVAGFVGVSVLILMFHRALQHLRRRSVYMLLAICVLIPAILGNDKGLHMPALFILWQTVVMLVLGYQIHKTNLV